MGKTKFFSKKAVSLVIAMIIMAVVATLAFSGTIASAETSGDFTYTVKDGKATITKYNGTATNLTIPSTLGGAKVTTIARNSFTGNNTIVNLTIPATVTSIDSVASYDQDEAAFYACKKLQTVTFVEGTSDAYIGDYAFENCVALLSVDIPGNYVSIGHGAFANCSMMTSMKFNPSSYSYANQTIYSYAFSGCTKLKSISLPNTLKTIGEFSFQGTAITNLVVPEGVTVIKRAAFRNCGNLLSVSFPSTLTSIDSVPSYDSDEGVFYNCSKLQSVTFAKGEADAYIGDHSFYLCVALQSLEIPGNYVSIGHSAFNACYMLKSVTFEQSSYSFPNQIIYSYAFSDCGKLKTVSLPTTLKSIGGFSFQGTAITDFVIPEGVANIDRGAFRNCDYLVSVSIPSTVTSIEGVASYDSDEGVFYNCTRLETVTIAPSDENECFVGAYAFKHCTSLKNIVVPGNYTYVGEGAFAECSSLESFKYNKSTYIYGNQFIGSYAFSSCPALKTVQLPETLGTIYSFAFQGTPIVNLEIPENVTVIGIGAFRNCKSLISVSLPSTLVRIDGVPSYDSDESAFYNCTALETVIFNDGEEDMNIGAYTFKNCTSLTTVHLPLNLISVGEGCFDGSKTNLTICAKSADSYAKTYADSNGIPFVICGGAHELPDVPDIPDIPVVTTYTLTYDANGGTGAPAAQTGASEYVISSTVPVRDGYKFLGWAFNANASTASCVGGANITLSSDTVLYAVWEKVGTPSGATTFTLSYNANGGTGAPAAQTGASEYVISSTVPVRDGYKFLGWAFDKNASSAACVGGANITLTYDVVLYAVWEKNATPPPVVTTYTLSYNANGGSGAPAAQSGATSYTISSAVPVRSGYKFLGWSTSASATSASYTAGKTISLTKNTTLYAVWQVVATETGKYVCPYCGEKFGEEKYEEHVQEEIILRNIAVVFRTPSTNLINYGDSIILHIDTYNLPAGSTIKWTVNNGNFAVVSYSADGKSCTITPSATGTTEITATVYDAEGREICSDSVMMSAKAGLWQKIVAFFKSIFGLTVVYTEIFKIK